MGHPPFEAEREVTKFVQSPKESQKGPVPEVDGPPAKQSREHSEEFDRRRLQPLHRRLGPKAASTSHEEEAAAAKYL
jgi:hypothetical protein